MKFLNYLMVCALGLSTLCFTACENDNEPRENDGSTTPATPTDKSLLVSSYARGTHKNHLSTFVYDSQCQLINGLWDGDMFTIQESMFNITFDDENVIFNTESNANGYVTLISYDEGYNLDSKLELIYDGDYITKIINEGEDYRSDIFYTWENGNITKIKYLFDNKEEFIYTFTYDTNTQKNSYIYMPYMIYDLDFLYYGGYVGKPTANIPTSVTVTENGETETYNITVKYDDKNRIVEYRENGALKCVYAYDGKTAEWPADEPNPYYIK